MPIPKLVITNPKALELIAKIKSGEFIAPFVIWYKKYKRYVISFAILASLIVFLAIGKKLSEKSPVPVYTPPEIDNPIPTEKTTVTSDFSGLKEEIQNFNTDVPDPFIPVFDNDINLEEVIL